ncbi:MAG: AAA family ATPase [Limnospira sp. PMC 1291.21]|uniref:ATP-binding sensor histidine kinase n=2 Tax=Limnospira TaxID=2596745 RepID=UPI0028E15640|nr:MULTISPECIES: AAA family ATPase [unclassified Limnospira]MDT9177414.1 AAA family ATPase [Limnospira sp. PMC 1238.20]MDT9208177.1 AAA family ATPase [Limnospira sp. PMC 1252.20]MDT9223054.1 AAA family ATPase [Limnospira sp. PMC 1279.21]MDT9228509.1 AAA family ATPase [Limnospira sp. PMC 1242.20]MDT9238475.1 AAA family ATPase [Limnospira sp. PMC 1261.20]
MIMTLPLYNFGEIIYQGTRTIVYKGTRTSDNQAVIIKVLRNPHPNFNELAQFRNQYTLAKNLELSGIVKPLSLENYGNSYALVMPYEGHISLNQWQPDKILIPDFLAIGLQLAEILHGLSQERVIHKDIKPANILIHPETKEIKLIDFSLASLLPKENQTIQNPNILEGTLAYLSPEQTGRMNRGTDYRSDLYSLGITFYQLLAGELPFNVDDPMELVYCHLAKMATPLHEVNPDVPKVLSDIVAKLMAKNAEDRYQSAWGLKHDLENCWQQWQKTGNIGEFAIASCDLSDRFLIPEKLYGRENEIEELLAAFDRVANGASEIMLVAGFSGIGKTAVVHEVHKPITRQQGYFIKGKFDQLNHNTPFSGFVQALRNLMWQLLSESDFQLEQWKGKILGALGGGGQVLIEVIPELEKIIGPQPPVPELSGTAAQNRFNLLFQKFISVLTTYEHPLVIFLDDLQWADLASLELMKLLMEEKTYLLLLGAYRDNEVSPVHPLMFTVEELKKMGKTVHTITLSPLEFEDSNQLVADTLACTFELADPITELINRKTKGNPFFITQFLKALYNDKCINFNLKKRSWECDLAQVNSLSITDDVVEFMATQLQKLPEETQQILQLAACLGNQFNLDTLAIVCEKSPTQVAIALWKALLYGLIIPETQLYKLYLAEYKTELNSIHTEKVEYKFLHDRVQQAAYSLIPEQQKQATHYRIGQLLLKQIPLESREDYIFDIISKLNYGIALIPTQKERDELAKLNLIACRKAKAATAYQAGLDYTQTGLYSLGEKSWERQYQITLEFYNLGAELAALSGDFETMNTFIDEVMSHGKKWVEKVDVYRIKIQANVAQNQLSQAIDIGQEFLQNMGVNYPANPTPNDINQVVAEVIELIGDRDIDDLVNLPLMTDLEKIAILQIANSMIPVAYICKPPLFPVFISLGVKLSIEYGNTSASAFSYACYGVICCNLLQDIDRGLKFGQLALTLVKKLDIKTAKPEVTHVVCLFILHRKNHLKTVVYLLQDSYKEALEIGNHEQAGYCAQTFCLNSFWGGETLVTLEKQSSGYYNALQRLNQITTANYCGIYWQSTLNLLGLAVNPHILSGEAMEETEILPRITDSHDVLGLYIFYLYKMMLSYLFAELKLAETYAIEAKKYLIGGAGMISIPGFYFYDSLTALGIYAPEHEQKSELWQRVEENQQHLGHWAYYAPMNHQHKLDLIEAEKCRVLDQKVEAINLYDQAILGAKKHEFIQEEALANELAAKFYLNWGKEKLAMVYMQEAYYCYARWGAKAKTEQLENTYPNLLKPILEATGSNLTPMATLATVVTPSISTHTSTSSNRSSGSSINNLLDFSAILKAAQAISSTIQLEELLQQLTKIILQNSGASRCALILPNPDGNWLVRSLATPRNTELCGELLSETTKVPVKLINYVKNTKKVVVIDDMQTDLPVIDKYLQGRKPKSMLCLPILNQGNLVGVLSLENRRISGVFTSDRLVVVNLLCTQAAISLENARLYQQSQDYVEQIKQSQLQLIQGEKMSALGNLIAGVAHEINNPVGFIHGNINEAIKSVQSLSEYLQLYQEKFVDPGEDMVAKYEELEIEYHLEDLPKMLESMKLGCDRIKDISTSLRIFSRADLDHQVSCDIHQGIDSTLLILKHRLKANQHRPAIDIVKNYGNLPQIKCFPGQINQVFMNILANAIDVLDEVAMTSTFESLKINHQIITISTQVLPEKNSVEIRIGDNGSGMPEALKSQIFDYLFTTKGVGKGTGLGLAIARQIVVNKHQGSLEVESEIDQGSEFRICLPID